MLDLKRLLRRKTRLASESTRSPPAIASVAQAPIADETQRDPPPYYTASNGQAQNGVAPLELLDPTLNFTAAQMEQQWMMKDKIFARAIVQFIAERFDGRERGWGGYKYTYICDVDPRLMGACELTCRARIRPGRRVHGTIFSGTMHGHIEDGLNK